MNIAKRIFDIIGSLAGLIVLSPILVIVGLIIAATSPGGAFFRGVRIGQYGKPFKIYKFRSMKTDSEGKGKWNVGDKDERITAIGHFLRNTKLDELPQLINVLKGDMSFVGPRPELKFYVDMYTDKEMKLLDLKPGITDWASLANFDQFQSFTKAQDPDATYLNHIRPLKLQLQLYYRDNNSFISDIRIIFWTLYKVLSRTQAIPKEIVPIVEKYQSELSGYKMLKNNTELAGKLSGGP